MEQEVQQSGTIPGQRRKGRSRHVEDVLVLQYPDLVRLAYLMLPVAMERHRRALTAHALVQGAVPGASRQPDEGQDTGDRIRARLVTAVLARTGDNAGRLRPRPLLPQVWGLHLFPTSGDIEGVTVEKEVGALPPAARVAYTLRTVDDATPATVRELLKGAGVVDPGEALQAADALAADFARRGVPAAELLRGDPRFDPSTLRAHTTDLLTRRRRRRIAGGVAALTAIAVAAWLIVGTGGGGDGDTDAGPGGRNAATAGAPLLAVPEAAWQHTTRLDFSVWTTRGGRAADRALLARASRAWAGGGPVPVTPGPGADPGPPRGDTRVMFAGDVDGAAVVLLSDTTRLARYTERPGGAVLETVRADDSDSRETSAVVLSRSPAGATWLTAPWVSTVAVRDLRKPDGAPTPVTVTEGVSAPVSVLPPATNAECGTVPVLELHSPKAADSKPYLLADLGDITPAHLTYMPPPEFTHTGRPSEAASSERSLTIWSKAGCTLGGLQNQGLRLVNTWEYAHFPLPEAGGESTWTCIRGFDRTGGGTVAAVFWPAAAEASTLTRVHDSPSCSRSGNDVLAATYWQAKSGTWYLLAAGSRDITRISAAGSLTAAADSRYLTAKAPGPPPGGAQTKVTGLLKDGRTLPALGG